MCNYLLKAISDSENIRVFAVNANKIVQDAQTKHNMLPSATVALGRVLIGTLFLGANLKGRDHITVKVNGNGPGGIIIAQSDAAGNVKGYIQNPQIDMKYNATGLPAIKETVGTQGNFQVIRKIGMGSPYVSDTPLVSGEIGEDFTYYMTVSEQIPSAFGLNVLLNEEGQVKIAGGFFVQVMPGATEEEIQEVEESVQSMPAISKILEQGEVEDLLAEIFKNDQYHVLDKMSVQFSCDCSKEKYGLGLASLGKKELQQMIDEDHGAEVICQFCEEKYFYTELELEKLKKKREGK